MIKWSKTRGSFITHIIQFIYFGNRNLGVIIIMYIWGGGAIYVRYIYSSNL